MTTYEKVKRLLEADPQYRDSDRNLIARIWNDEITASGLYTGTTGTAYFLSEFANDKYTFPDEITRARRRVQQDHPFLRGRVYELRHKKAKTYQHS